MIDGSTHTTHNGHRPARAGRALSRLLLEVDDLSRALVILADSLERRLHTIVEVLDGDDGGARMADVRRQLDLAVQRVRTVQQQFDDA